MNEQSSLCGDPTFTAGPGRFSIGLASKETGTGYHLHLSEAEAQRFAESIETSNSTAPLAR